MLLRRITRHVKGQNWFAVGIDFVIVVVGVFIGIQVANWNAERMERSQEAEVDQVRFDYLLREHAWATYNIWDRVEKGLQPSVHFSDGAGPDFLRLLCTPGGATAWARIRSELPQPYVDDLDRLAGPYADEYAVSCSPSDGLEQS